MSEARSGDQIRVWVIGVNNAPTGNEPHYQKRRCRRNAKGNHSLEH